MGRKKLDRKWYALSLRPSADDAKVRDNILLAARTNKVRGFGRVLSPTRLEVVKDAAGKKRCVAARLFPGYLICELDYGLPERSLLQELPGVDRLLPGYDNPTAIETRELAYVFLQELTGKRPKFLAGDRCHVLTGVMAGRAGTVRRVEGDLIRVSVPTLIMGNEVVAEVDSPPAVLGPYIESLEETQ